MPFKLGEYTENVHFHNNTVLPIMVDGFVSGSLICKKVLPGEKLVLHSTVGEWHMNSMFEDYTDSKIWIDKGLKKYTIVGKFRSDPCIQGNYSWMEYDDDMFECTYSEVDSSDVKGLITLKCRLVSEDLRS
jgi:hypothetical protein